MSSVKTDSEPRTPSRYDREPPFSIEAEISVLAGILLDPEAMVRIEEIVDEAMFFREGHRVLFRTMRQLQEKRTAIDPVTVGDHLHTTGELERAGGMEYLALLIDAVPTAANVQYHARIVRDKALLRRLIDASTQTIQDIYEPGDRSVDDLVDAAEARMFQVAETNDRGGFVKLTGFTPNPR